MNVLIISDAYYDHPRRRFSSGGVIHRQAAELVREGVDCAVLCPVPRLPHAARQHGPDPMVSPDGIPVEYFRYWNPPYRFSTALAARLLRLALSRAIHHYVRERDVDLIHAHRLFPFGWAALGVARQLGKPLLVSARGSDVHTHPVRNATYHRYSAQTIRECDRLLTVSDELARGAETLATPAAPVRTVYNGVDIEMFRPMDRRAARRRLGLPAGGIGICMVGRLMSEKGVHELMAAFSAIGSTHPSVWLALVGDGPLAAEVRSWRAATGFRDRIFVPGAAPPSKVAEWLNAADVFVLPTYNEGLPNAMLEAMACALPIVATNVGGIPEAVTDGESAILIPPRSAGSLRFAIERLILESRLRDRMGQAALRTVRARFSWALSAARLRAIYEEVVGLPESRNTASTPRISPS